MHLGELRAEGQGDAVNRLAIPAAVPADTAERLSDRTAPAHRPDFMNEQDVREIVPDDLAGPIASVVACRNASPAEFEAARQKLVRALAERWRVET